MVKLDSNAAWKEAAGLVAVNREVLLTLAGVFLLLPSLLSAIIAGDLPPMASGMEADQMLALLQGYYARNWWIIVASAAIQIIGLLAILRLMRDRQRPTVGEAIRAGLGGFPTYFAAQVLFIIGASVGGGLAIGLLALFIPALAGLLLPLALLFIVFAAVRLLLVAPIVAVEGERNPLAAIARSWAMTRGNFWRIFAFLLLVGVLFLVAMTLIMIVVGIVLAVFTQGELQRFLASLVSSALSAAAGLYLMGIIAAIHRQLAAPAETRPIRLR